MKVNILIVHFIYNFFQFFSKVAILRCRRSCQPFLVIFSGFQIHLRECGLPRGLIKSNRGNRLHILFNQSEVHANNFAVFEKYISSVCPKDIDFLKELEQNYKSREANEQIQALALFNVLFSAPWIQHFYRDSTTTYSHMDAFIKVRTCKIIDFPLLLLAVFRNRLSQVYNQITTTDGII